MKITMWPPVNAVPAAATLHLRSAISCANGSMAHPRVLLESTWLAMMLQPLRCAAESWLKSPVKQQLPVAQGCRINVPSCKDGRAHCRGQASMQSECTLTEAQSSVISSDCL